jgi:hypothetical protein
MGVAFFERPGKGFQKEQCARWVLCGTQHRARMLLASFCQSSVPLGKGIYPAGHRRFAKQPASSLARCFPKATRREETYPPPRGRI